MTNNDAQSDGKKRTADEIARIPNGVHLYRIREALGKGHAAVMIGSGFSLNAEGGSRLPVWDGLVGSLLADLYPSEKERQDAKKSLGGTSGMLRLTEEYAALRGRAQLDVRLHELLPDAGVVMPGDLHTKLLALRWADIYTTNYDTLLERALDKDRTQFQPSIQRRYQIVVAAEDVPFSRSNGGPRVIKLHGSLRTGSKLIVTEEDYRSYPTRFAPFVNTVQQSMLENVFCLIGFSGDDPNFLAWTGWVRDRLGDKTPPIYLITLKPVSEGQRLTLERRNVFPINIASLGSNSQKVDYRLALTNLLDFWSAEQPPLRADWPLARATQPFNTAKSTVSQLIAWVSLAKGIRASYPGWLVAPATNRTRLIDNFGVWLALRAFQVHQASMPSWLRLVLLDEVVWAYNTALVEPPRALIAAIDNELVPPERKPSSSEPEFVIESSVPLKPTARELDAVRARLLLAALRDARLAGHAECFESWKAFAAKLPVSDLSVDLQCSLVYEYVLFDLEHADYRNISSLLDQFESLATRATDHYWLVRAGALCGERNAVRRGHNLVRSALLSIRNEIQASGETTYLVSREQWAENLFQALHFAVNERHASEAQALESRVPLSSDAQPAEVSLASSAVREELVRNPARAEETEARDRTARENVEHPESQTAALWRDIKVADDMLKTTEVDIDSESIPNRRHTSYVRQEDLDAAATYYRVMEFTATVPCVGKAEISARRLVSCYRIMAAAGDASGSLRVFTRACSGDVLSTAEVFTPSVLTSLDERSARMLFDLFVRRLRGALSWTEEAWAQAELSELKFAFDIVARMAFRLDADDALSLLNLAISLHDVRALRGDYHLQRTFKSFVNRILRLLPERVLVDLSPQLLALTPPSEILFPHRSSWPYMSELLGHLHVTAVPNGNWRPIVDQILEQTEAAVLKADADDTANFFNRLDWIYRSKVMTESQKTRFARLIWHRVNDDGLPDIRYFYPAVVLIWPSTGSRHNVDNKLRQWLAKQSVAPIEKLTDFNGEQKLGISSPSEAFLFSALLTVGKDVNFEWSTSELLSLMEKLRTWWSDEGLRLSRRALEETGDDTLTVLMSSRLRLIAHVLHRVVGPRLDLQSAERNGIPAWLKEVWDVAAALKTPLVPLLFAGLNWWPEKTSVVIDLTITTLKTNTDTNVVSAALNAAGVWLLSRKAPDAASRRYVSYLIDELQRRSDDNLELVLNSVDELLNLVTVRHFEEQKSAICSSVHTLLYQLAYGTSSGGTFAAASNPLLRSAAASLLATVLRRLPLGPDEKMQDAISLASSDPLLSVRRHVLNIN
jgi:hypothetical protein